MSAHRFHCCSPGAGSVWRQLEVIEVAGMSNVHACERLLPTVGQFAAEQIHQQPVREAAVAPTPVLPHHADGAEAHLGIAASPAGVPSAGSSVWTCGRTGRRGSGKAARRNGHRAGGSLPPPAAAERVTAASEPDPHDGILTQPAEAPQPPHDQRQLRMCASLFPGSVPGGCEPDATGSGHEHDRGDAGLGKADPGIDV
jgi:hypothetical protein